MIGGHSSIPHLSDRQGLPSVASKMGRQHTSRFIGLRNVTPQGIRDSVGTMGRLSPALTGLIGLVVGAGTKVSEEMDQVLSSDGYRSVQRMQRAERT